jgi:Xaa-Pro dipeptidase
LRKVPFFRRKAHQNFLQDSRFVVFQSHRGFSPSWTEPVHLFGDSKYILQAGMVLTVEPPVFLGDEHLGARIIDNVLVTEYGTEILSRFSWDLIVVD